ncbi:MAG: nitrous oxide reductase family maturation protein NosD [Alphaproteobacteria bacterium]|nr:nitrous oxide reductase family maturation protein NosD [Rhodospirillales bacterium]MCW9046052.1 nitrous oxide reductase family maturation protein NosD [Alphaproteobacteria bacterium]
MVRLSTILLALIIGFIMPSFAAEVLPLQQMIDDANKGDVVTPPPGIYKGPIIIDKALVLDGLGKVTIDAGGEGTIITLDTDGATIKNLILRNSGDQHNDLDSGVQIRGNYNVVKDNVMENVLFGVELQQSNNNIVRRNKIGSHPFSLGVRGDGIRLWYSMENKITDNVIDGARDMVIWYSTNNEIMRNKISNGRYGLHFMYSKYNLVEENDIFNNNVGIFLMYSDDVVIKKNRIVQALGPTGMGIGMKESSNVEVSDNKILYAAIGIYLDVSPYQPDTTNRFYRNTLAFTGIGVKFLNDWQGNLLADNRFENNIHQVSVAAGATAKRNEWDGNYWDDYEGFDRNKDNTGDFPYDIQVFADRIWMDVPHAAYFKGSPILTALDFMERLAPFTEPILMLRDAKPKMDTTFKAPKASEAKAVEGMGTDDRIDPFGLNKRLQKKE